MSKDVEKVALAVVLARFVVFYLKIRFRHKLFFALKKYRFSPLKSQNIANFFIQEQKVLVEAKVYAEGAF